ncbi:MAG: sugar phosphorylase [Eubacteriales bacterium]|nr:sugar phosphorylase [Eubacteriales bacterium]
MRTELREKLSSSLLFIYKDEDIVKETLSLVDQVLDQYTDIPAKGTWISEKDSILITYGDSLYRDGESGLKTLKSFLDEHVQDAISTVHLLPMFPYTSDDGFSVVDYKKINPDLGDWEDVNALAKSYDLMFDAVVNHVSKSSMWFEKYLSQEYPYNTYFIDCDPDADYSSVTRPRALPLLTEFETTSGEKKYLWTTFSTDQIDLNFRSPHVYAEILDVLLSFAQNGARFIRLDAIGFIWKEPGTTCMHLPETHELIKTYRMLLDTYAPGVCLITETNVPHKDNISYFGNGHDEAQLIYQFPLPPLTMFSFLTGNAEKLSRWADGLDEPVYGTSYFNFLSSHDGVGVRPTEGILTKEEQQILVDATLKNGGAVSYKDNGDGTKSPYELNINYQDALASPEDTDEVRIARFLAAETILLSLQGLPGIYIHSLLGSRNDYYGMNTSGIPRRINREKLDADKLSNQLRLGSNRKVIFDEMIRRIKIRKSQKAFSPVAHQKIIFDDQRIFALERFTDTGEKITVLVNVSSDAVHVHTKVKGYDLIADTPVGDVVILEPLQCMWILGDEC